MDRLFALGRKRRARPVKRKDISKRPRRQNEFYRERVHDPYKTRLKLEDPTVCPQCGAIYRDGRWSWKKLRPDESAREEMCQACQRINVKYPAGEVTLSGEFLQAHKDEIMGLVRNTEKVENEEHPLHCIMDIDDEDGNMLITTTDIHLPRRIGQAIFDAYEGDFDFNYDEEGYFIRVSWRRDE